MSRLGSFVSSVGTALNNAAMASHDANLRQRVREIDEELDQLRMERDHHIANLYEPRTNEVVSMHYVPGQWQPRPTPLFGERDLGGRLTQCSGRRYTNDYRMHPGCPYSEKNHGEHEFTLRD